MAYPAGITLRTVNVGGATALESGEPLTITVRFAASRSLIWGATGWRFPSVVYEVAGTVGNEITVDLPVTDQSGWRTNSNQVIDVSAAGSYTHTYTATVVTMANGRVVSQDVIGPFALPADDLSPVDLDLTLPTTTVAGGVVQVPDVWSQQVADAVAAAGSADAAAASAAAADADRIAAEAAASSAAGSASAASSSASLAAGSASAASGSADAAALSAGEASASATAADGSATAAANSASTAATSASNAAATLAAAVTLTTAQTITGAKTITAPTLVGSPSEPSLGANLAPAIDGWTLAGGASYANGTVMMVSGGSMSCTIPGVVSGAVYQITVTRTGQAGTMTVTLGAVSVDYAASIMPVTVVAGASGSLTLTLGGAWAASVTGVSVQLATLAEPRTRGVVTRASGSNNAMGADAQRSLTTGGSNNAMGHNAQRSLTTGSFNNAVGHIAQRSLTTGSSNNALGTEAQHSLTTGSFNNAVGSAAQFSLTTGSANNAVGNAAQRSPRGITAWATTTASRQVSIGHESGQGSAAQSDDIVTVGYRAIADGAKAMSLGSMASAVHAGSVALGADVTTTAPAQVAVGARDLEVQDATKGLVLRSPDGSRWRATISNAGAVTWTKL